MKYRPRFTIRTLAIVDAGLRVLRGVGGDETLGIDAV